VIHLERLRLTCKHYTSNLGLFVISYSVCPWKVFPAMFNVCKVRPGDCPRVEDLRGASLGKTPFLPANI
jgi:hypothetical protein